MIVILMYAWVFGAKYIINHHLGSGGEGWVYWHIPSVIKMGSNCILGWIWDIGDNDTST